MTANFYGKNVRKFGKDVPEAKRITDYPGCHITIKSKNYRMKDCMVTDKVKKEKEV